MPIKIDNQLPARHSLELENIFVMSESRATHQDIRPLKIVILNLMPTKIETETQLLRLLSNSPIQVEVELLQTATHRSKNTSAEHMLKFYKTIDDIRDLKFDGMIVTGAPIENLEFEEVDYWDELCDIFDWAKKNVYSTMFICWGAQAALYYHYGIKKYALNEKLFGIFPHKSLDVYHPLLRGLDDIFYVPHSRYTDVSREDIENENGLLLLSYSDISGVHIAADKNSRCFYITGHSEYDRTTLANEYFRDINKGIKIKVPYNYFPDNDPQKTPPMIWRGAANIIFSNWINYFVYQRTPYDLDKMI
ncbi:MAG: homoserine O-succinyltransferase [Oscillospiraceae bacterium]|nr:homoserine O-succinyltransferase [Oscillospiraceae bacterium]